MPIIWMGFSTASSDGVHDRRRQPHDLKAWVSDVVESSYPRRSKRKPKLLELYFQADTHYACALIEGLDDYVAVKAVAEVLGAEYATKFLTADKAHQAIRRSDRMG
jgi:hypothetical protein